MNLIQFEEIDSTNNYAKAHAGEFFEPTIVIAEKQTSGRGRLGRQFFSPSESGLYMSLVFSKDSINNFNPAKYTATAAVAVARVLDDFFKINTKIKWVNDIYLNGKKICGILTEGTTGTKGTDLVVIVGVGVNLSTNNFPAEITNKAGSITNKNIGKTEKTELARKIAAECIRIFDSNEQTQIALNEYRERSFLIGKKVTVHPVIDNEATDYTAVVKEITDDAKLIVQLPDNSTKALDSGEISIRMSC